MKTSRARRRRVIVVLALISGVLLVGVALVRSVSSEDETAPVLAEPPRDPIECLQGAGLSDVEQRETTEWFAVHPEPRYTVRVDVHSSSEEAEDVVADAVYAYAAHVGPFVIMGPLKPSVEGSELADEREGTEAAALLREIAACIGAG